AVLRPRCLAAGRPPSGHALVNRQVRAPPRRGKRRAPRAITFGRPGFGGPWGRGHGPSSYIVSAVGWDLCQALLMSRSLAVSAPPVLHPTAQPRAPGGG